MISEHGFYCCYHKKANNSWSSMIVYVMGCQCKTWPQHRIPLSENFPLQDLVLAQNFFYIQIDKVQLMEKIIISENFRKVKVKDMKSILNSMINPY